MQIIIWNTRDFDWNHFEHNSCNFSWIVIPGSKYHWAVVIVEKSSNALNEAIILTIFDLYLLGDYVLCS